jgi:transposase-like protein
MLGRMDSDAPHPHCPFCGLPMHAKRRAPDVCCTLQAFDCKWCGVVLNVSPQAEILELAALALG